MCFIGCKFVTRQLTANASFSVSLPSSRLQWKANFMQKNFVFPPINFQLNCHWIEVVHADFPYRYNSLEATTIHATNINNWAIAVCNNKKNIYTSWTAFHRLRWRWWCPNREPHSRYTQAEELFTCNIGSKHSHTYIHPSIASYKQHSIWHRKMKEIEMCTHGMMSCASLCAWPYTVFIGIQQNSSYHTHFGWIELILRIRTHSTTNTNTLKSMC